MFLKRHFTGKVILIFRRTRGRRGGGCHPPPPQKVFLSFFLEYKTIAPDVFSSCSFIPRADFEMSLVMVSCYGFEIAGGQANFWWKFMFFQLLSTIKANPVAKIIQTVYLCVIFHVKHQKLSFIAVLTWFPILGKIQDGGQNGDHCWWRHRPPAAPPVYLSLLRRSNAFN